METDEKSNKSKTSNKHGGLGLGKFGTSKKEKEFNFGKDEFLKLEAERKQVEFDASFECANLESVRRKKKGEYDIFIRSDSNSN